MGIRRIRWLFALLAIPTLTCHALDLNKTVTNRGTEVWGVDELGGSKWALVVEYEDMNLNLTNNSYNKYGYDTNWTLVEVPDFNTKLVVEYEDIPQQNLNFTKNTDGKYDDGNWTLDKVPDFDTRLVVEYEDINFTEDAVGYWTLSEVPDFNIKLVVEYVIKDASSQEWSMKIGPEVNSRLVVEYDDINLNFTEEATGNWTLSEAPDFNTKLVVEYESVLPEIALLDNADNSTVLTANEGQLVEATLTDRTLFKDDNWNTLTLPFDVPSLTGTPLEGATIMEMNTTKKNGFDTESGTLYLAFTNATQIEAGKPYIVKWTSGTDIVEPVFNDVTISSTTPTAVESATSGLETVKMVGNYAPVTVKADDQSIMFMGDDNSLYYSSEDRTLRNFRAHFEIPSQQSAPALARSFVIDFDGDEVVTGIDGIRIAAGGQNDGWYSLDGRRLDRKPTRKGVYIHNGNKVIVK